MSKFHNAAREKHPGRSRVKHILKGYKRGGAVHDDEAQDRKLFKKMLAKEDKGEHAVSGHKGKARLDKRARGGGVDKFARGGRTKKSGGTHINIAVVSPNKKPDDQQQQMPPPMPPMPPAPPSGGPMGGPPMPPPGGPMQTGGVVSTYASGGGVEGYDIGGGVTNEIGDPRRAYMPGGQTNQIGDPRRGGLNMPGGTSGGGGKGGGFAGPGGPGPGGPPMRIPPGPPPHPAVGDPRMMGRTNQTGDPRMANPLGNISGGGSAPQLMGGPVNQIGDPRGAPMMGGQTNQIGTQNVPGNISGGQIPPQIMSYLSQFAGNGGKGGGAPIGANAGGAVGYRRGGGVKFTGGAESGEGRLEKAARQKRRG